MCNAAHLPDQDPTHLLRLQISEPPPVDSTVWGLTIWPLHDIVIANIVWCMAYKREVVGGVVYCAIDV